MLAQSAGGWRGGETSGERRLRAGGQAGGAAVVLKEDTPLQVPPLHLHECCDMVDDRTGPTTHLVELCPKGLLLSSVDGVVRQSESACLRVQLI